MSQNDPFNPTFNRISPGDLLAAQHAPPASTEPLPLSGLSASSITSTTCEWCGGGGWLSPGPTIGLGPVKLIPCHCTQARQADAATARARQRLGDELGGLRDKTFDGFDGARPLEPIVMYGSLYIRPAQRDRILEAIPIEIDRNKAKKAMVELSVERQQTQLQTAITVCRSYAERPRGWLCLHGSYGGGKSHLAAAVALSRVASCWQVRYRSLPGLLDALKAGFADNSSDTIFQDLLDCDLLVLDDLGAEHFTNWSKDRIFRLLNEREHKATVITSNMHPDDLAPATDIDAQRLMSRIVGNARCVWLPLSDYRRLRSER